jgi:hypothetical protein
MPLTSEEVLRIKRMNDDELVSNAHTEDVGVVVEAMLRLHHTTRKLNVILIWLTAVLVVLTTAWFWRPSLG